MIYSAFIMLSYVVLCFISRFSIRKYDVNNGFVNFEDILHSPLAPRITLIAPAYNEGVTIIENVKSLLSIRYRKLDIIIVNDGSTDDTMEKLKIAYRLEKYRNNPAGMLKTKQIKGVYRSSYITTHNLIIIDKANGGKSDALNAGLNYAKSNLVACIDVDCILEPDSLQKMVKPFLESEGEVIATGGIVRISNSSQVMDGHMVEAKLPKRWLERFQFLEYLRAFLIGRMAWSKLNGLLIVSGAFGLFRKDIAMKCGGYDTGSIGEDMELIVRMRKYMHKLNRKYKVVYIPDPLCWTEVPSNISVLGRQRNRWTRGLIDTLVKHKDICLNPKFKLMGMLSYPFWLFFEWMAPLLEIIGLTLCIYQLLMGNLYVENFLVLLLFVYVFAFALSCFSLLQDELTTFKYVRRKDLLYLILTALIEPIVFHPMTVYWSLRGNIDYLKGKKRWGEMKRSGFKAV